MSGPETARRLTEWFRQWRNPLRKFLIGQGAVPAADVNDVAQEVFLRLLRYDRAELVDYPQAYFTGVSASAPSQSAVCLQLRSTSVPPSVGPSSSRHLLPKMPRWEQYICRELAGQDTSSALSC